MKKKTKNNSLTLITFQTTLFKRFLNNVFEEKGRKKLTIANSIQFNVPDTYPPALSSSVRAETASRTSSSSSSSPPVVVEDTEVSSVGAR